MRLNPFHAFCRELFFACLFLSEPFAINKKSLDQRNTEGDQYDAIDPVSMNSNIKKVRSLEFGVPTSNLEHRTQNYELLNSSRFQKSLPFFKHFSFHHPGKFMLAAELSFYLHVFHEFFFGQHFQENSF